MRKLAKDPARRCTDALAARDSEADLPLAIPGYGPPHAVR